MNIRRPLFLLLTGLVLGELSGYLLSQTGVIIPASLLCVALCVRGAVIKGEPFFVRHPVDRTVLRMGFLCIGMIFLGHLSWCREYAGICKAKDIVRQTRGTECRISGTVTGRKEGKNGSVSFLLKDPVVCPGSGSDQETRYVNIKGKCQCYAAADTDGAREYPFCPGDRITIYATLSFPQRERNPGGFDEQTYDLAGGILLKGNVREIPEWKSAAFSIRKMAYKIKIRMEDGYLRNLKPEDNAMLCAMIFGERSGLTREQRKLYEENGMMHLLAVSGLHVAGVGGRIYRFLRRRGVPYSVACLAGAFLLCLYGFMTGFGPSVMRAILMFLVFLGSEYLGTSYDLISAMSLSGILMILEYPHRLLDGGFLVSFASVTAVGWITPCVRSWIQVPGAATERRGMPGGTRNLPIPVQKIRHFPKRCRERFPESVLTSLIVFLVTAPLIMRFYYECSPYSVLLNPVVLPFMGILMTSALLGGLLGCFGSLHPIKICIYVCSFPALCILRWYHGIFAGVRKLPGALFITGCPSVRKLLLLYGLELLLLYLLKNKSRIRFCMALCLFLFCMTVPNENSSGMNQCRITMLDVGQGDCILIRMAHGKTMLIDGGSSTKEHVYEDIIEPALCYYGINKLDYVVITHMDEDHISGIREMLAEGYPVGTVLTGTTYVYTVSEGIRHVSESKEEIYQLACANHTTFRRMEKNDFLEIGEMVFDCLHPRKGEVYSDRNDKSLTFLFHFREFSALFPGDLGMEQERSLMESLQEPVTFLKVAHHGSKYSTGRELLDVIRPCCALISVGERNRYGHPHRELLNRLGETGAEVFRTDRDGAIVVKTDGLKWETMTWMKQ